MDGWQDAALSKDSGEMDGKEGVLVLAFLGVVHLVCLLSDDNHWLAVAAGCVLAGILGGDRAGAFRGRVR